MHGLFSSTLLSWPLRLIKMKKHILYILLMAGLVNFSCKNQGINNIDIENHEMSDFWEAICKSKDHQDYISFLNEFPDSEHFETALTRYIEYKKNYFDTVPHPTWDCFRNCIKIEVDSIGGTLFENDSISLTTLRKAVLNQLINPNDDQYLPEKKIVVDDSGVERAISKGFLYVIIRHNYPSILKTVTIELKKAIDDYKGYLSLNWYNKPINKISQAELNYLESVCRTWYFFDKFDFYRDG